MLLVPQLPFLGALIVELREGAHLGPMVGNVRVRGPEPAKGDADDKAVWKAFVLLNVVDAPVHPSLPIVYAQIGAKCYGTSHDHAYDVWLALVKEVHAIGPRVKASGLGIYRTEIISGGAQETDPDTDQPYVTGTIQAIVTAQAVA